MNTAGTVALATLSGVGLLLSLLTLNISLIAVQAMRGTESLIELLVFFSASFAISFGVAAACTLPWYGPQGPLQAGGAFAVGGLVGGALQAISVDSIARFEPQLRAITDGGPLGIFLLTGNILAFATAAVVGTVLLRWAHRRRLAAAGREDL